MHKCIVINCGTKTNGSYKHLLLEMVVYYLPTTHNIIFIIIKLTFQIIYSITIGTTTQLHLYDMSRDFLQPRESLKYSVFQLCEKVYFGDSFSVE